MSLMLETTENVPLGVELAGPANRIFAFLIDMWIMLCFYGVLLLGFAPILRFNSELFKTIAPLAGFLLIFGFHFFQEWLMGGRTIGKGVLGIRVVREDGQPIGFWDAFGRNLMRIVDVYLAGIGLLVLLVSGREKRFGDYLAGTLVVYEPRVPRDAFNLAAESLATARSPEAAAWLRALEARRLSAYAKKSLAKHPAYPKN